MAKVGILTFHCADNFGAVLQAYALMRSIKKRGMDVEIIDFCPLEIVHPYTQFVNFRYSLKERGILRTIKDAMVRWIDYRAIKRRRMNFKAFRDQYFILSSRAYRTRESLIRDKPIYDFYITGSDQVWNPDFSKYLEGTYFLDFVEKPATKISYAASIARKINDDDVDAKYFKKYIGDFEYISVREKSSKEFVSKYANCEVAVTLDPTLLLVQDEWNEIIPDESPRFKYVLVYDIFRDPVTVGVSNLIAKELNCKIISYSLKKGFINWYRSFSADNPAQFLGLVRNAEFVITNSFHGTIFSVIFNKPFFTIPHPTRGNRMIDLLNDLHLDDRIISRIEDVKDRDRNISFEDAYGKLSQLKAQSIHFLEKSLGMKN